MNMENQISESKSKILQPKLINPPKPTKGSKHILLIHGFATDSRSWRLFIERNKKNYIHIINLPGHGSLEYTKRELDFDFIVNAIVDHIIEMDCKKVILMGHSFGGGISLVVNEKLKKMKINKIEKLFILAPYTKYSIPKVYNKIPLFNVKGASDFLSLQEEIFKNAKKTLEKLEEYFYEKETIKFFKSNWKYLRYIIYQMSRPSTFAKINNAINYITDKTYLFLGEEDRLVPSELIIERFKEIKPLIYISVYKNCGHGFFAEKDSYFFNEVDRIIYNKKEKT